MTTEEKPTRSTDLVNYADKAMFEAEPHETYEPTSGVMPKVHLVSMSPDPLGEIASLSEMYKGNVVRSLSDLTDDQRRDAFEDAQKTHLQAPLESVKLHFLIDGVNRAFTQQLERQRTAVYAEQSLRFAVVENLSKNVTLPPSLSGTVPTSEPEANGPFPSKAQSWRNEWEWVLSVIEGAYDHLVADGMPQEDARELLPFSVATRVHYVTDLRNLVGHAGNRLCTQAQFHWRSVFAQIVGAIRDYAHTPDGAGTKEYGEEWARRNGWQFQALASSALFRPVCYQLGRCPFNASYDRGCTIRPRVENFAAQGIPSSHWGPQDPDDTEGINEVEWLLNPSAARER